MSADLLDDARFLTPDIIETEIGTDQTCRYLFVITMLIRRYVP